MAPRVSPAAFAEVEALFVDGQHSEALDRSEALRRSGYISPKLAVIQVVCLEHLGFEEAAVLRLGELRRALGSEPGADALLQIARESIALNKRLRSERAELDAQSRRYLPRLAGPPRGRKPALGRRPLGLPSRDER